MLISDILMMILQAVSQEQHLIIPVSMDAKDGDFLSAFEDLSMSDDHPRKAEIEDLLLSLPRNLHWDKQKQQEKSEQKEQQQQQKVTAPLDILEEEEEGDEEEKAEEGLEIAWQYRKSVQQERLALSQTKSLSTTVNVFCHSYDLSGRMNEQSPINLSAYMVTMRSDKETASDKQASGFVLFRELVSLLKGKEEKAIRILLFHPHLEKLAVALPLLLSYVRDNSIPAVIMVCTPPTAHCKSWTQLSRACDVVLKTEGFSSRREYPPPPEFRHLQGLLTISKASTVTAATANGGGHYSDLTISKRPAAFIYGFKRDRRKLHIPLLHIPPEDYAQGGGSVGSGVRSGAGKVGETKKTKSGMGCASNSGSALDF